MKKSHIPCRALHYPRPVSSIRYLTSLIFPNSFHVFQSYFKLNLSIIHMRTSSELWKSSPNHISAFLFWFCFFCFVARVTACHTVVTYDDAVGDINSAIRHTNGQDRKWRRFLVWTRRELNFRSDILGHLSNYFGERSSGSWKWQVRNTSSSVLSHGRGALKSTLLGDAYFVSQTIKSPRCKL